ncbi:MAG: hypothetical protein J6R18_04775 [Kiritimatiellae bacterium]|nr:hypothetical protein [Kiritimatiellia bacterium]
MTTRENKKGQVAIFLVLILAGLTLLFALNIDIFTSSRSKIRLQNAADASAIALARWQGITLNVIGELNIARLAAICQSNNTAISGIVQLQRKLAYVGPTIGFKAANDIARKNGVPISPDMTEATRLVANFTDPEYRQMLDVVVRNGIRAGVDNAAVLRPGCIDPRTDPDFYEAIRSRDFRTLCCRFSGGSHNLPNIPSGAIDPDEIMLSDGNACFGSLGAGWEHGGLYHTHIDRLASIAHDYGIDEHVINRQALSKNAFLFHTRQWCVYDRSEWRDLPDEFDFSRFPWLTPLREEYNVCGGSATIRVEDHVALASLAAQTNFITSQAAAKTFGSANGPKVTDVSPAIILPSFSKTRLVPFGIGAAGRYGMANIFHVKSMLGLLSFPNGGNAYRNLLDVYNSDEFRAEAEAWYSNHGHNDADGCHPPGNGTERGGGSPYGI